ncbi:hypothetical protein GCM10027418_06000 [Mariniluteicoccus endophyticus]
MDHPKDPDSGRGPSHFPLADRRPLADEPRVTGEWLTISLGARVRSPSRPWPASLEEQKPASVGKRAPGVWKSTKESPRDGFRW